MKSAHYITVTVSFICSSDIFFVILVKPVFPELQKIIIKFTFVILPSFRVHYSDFLSISNYTPNQWSMFKGYSKQAPMDAYPFRALLSGQKNGLQLNLAIRKKDIDYHCKTSLQGFRVILHIPSRFPSASQDYFRVPLNSVVIASVTPTMITTAKSLENYSPNIRNCYFPKEKRLALFKTYTFLNCKFECLTNFTLKTCKCVNFHMPSKGILLVNIPSRFIFIFIFRSKWHTYLWNT